MSKKHFNAIASAMRANKPAMHIENIAEYGQWGNDVLALASTLESFNPAFDKLRFIAACNGE